MQIDRIVVGETYQFCDGTASWPVRVEAIDLERGAVSVIECLPNPRSYDVRARALCLLPGSRPQTPTVIAYTTAPDAYDGFGTVTLSEAGLLDRKPLRKVQIEQAHYDWQSMRYGSGMYPCFDETEFQKLQGLPWYHA